MGEPSIDHLLCTHCTFGTSALEDASADAAPRVLGYSVRASSIKDRSRLRDEFRAIERLLSYELPVDAAADLKSKLDATTAPVRLCFIPDIAGRQVAGHVAFRQFDTAKRPGSYFAHLLVAPAASQWAAIDVLRLWGVRDPSGHRGWADCDRAEGFPNLLPIESLKAWPPAEQLWLSDKVARAFLETGAAPSGLTPATVLPKRWATDIAVSNRIWLLEMLLQAVLEKRGLPGVVMASEPAVAAVLFYSVLSLLPRSVARGLGFSTYESDPSRSAASLAATTFVSPESDFRPQAYEGSALTINTFRSCEAWAGTHKPSPGEYAKWAVRRLLAGEIMRVRELCAAIDAVWRTAPPTVEEMNQVIFLEDFRRKLFQRQDEPMPRKLSEELHRFFAMRCANTLQKNAEALRKLSPQKSAGLVTRIEAILRPLPAEWNRLTQDKRIAEWLSKAQPLDEASVLNKLAQPASRISDDELVSLILSCECVTKERRLPYGAPLNARLWGEIPSQHSQAEFIVPPLLMKVLVKLDAEGTIRILPRPLPPLAVILGLAQAMLRVSGDIGVTKRARLLVRQVLDEAAGGEAAEGQFEQGLDHADFELLLGFAGDCAGAYDPVPGRFGRRVSDFIRSFDKRVSDVCFDSRLINLGNRWKGCCPYDEQEELGQRLNGWKRTLSWFAVYDDKDKIPFKGVTRTAFTADVSSVLPGEGAVVDGRRREILLQILDECRTRKIIRAKDINHLAALIDTYFPPTRR